MFMLKLKIAFYIVQNENFLLEKMRTLQALGAAMRICVMNDKQSTPIEGIVKKNV